MREFTLGGGMREIAILFGFFIEKSNLKIRRILDVDFRLTGTPISNFFEVCQSASGERLLGVRETSATAF